MNLFIFRRWYYRLSTGILAGLLTWFLVEVGLNIQYRYFLLFNEPLNYLYAAVIGALMMENIYRAGLWLDKNRAWELGPTRRFILQNIMCVIIAAFWILAVRFFLYSVILPGKLIILTDEVLVFFLVLFFTTSLNLAELGSFLIERYRKSLAEIEKFRKENAEYQFEMLKLQLNPHFLFNSLNTLSSLIHEDQAKSSEFIRRLSDVYRYVLDNRHKELVSLREEMAFIQSFTFLLGLRFQGMIDFRFNVSELLLEKKIAPMTLQLLVENAVKHNVASRKTPLWIEIVGENNTISVSNNFQPKEGQEGTGVGLKNIASRYEFLSGRGVKILNDNQQFKVVIPLI
jgi:two-component system, LytTR family, sensor kinase